MKKYKEISVVMPDGKIIKFLVGNAIIINEQATETRVTDIKKSLFGKTVFIHLSDGSVLSYHNFPYILI